MPLESLAGLAKTIVAQQGGCLAGIGRRAGKDAAESGERRTKPQGALGQMSKRISHPVPFEITAASVQVARPVRQERLGKDHARSGRAAGLVADGETEMTNLTTI